MNNLFADTLTINGTEIEARVTGQDVYSFGDTKSRKHYLRSANEVIGFLNAVADVMDEGYAIVIPGFHSKFSWETLPLETQGEGRAYVNFDLLTDGLTLAKLAEFGIEKLPGVFGWLSIKTKFGRIFPDKYANPKTSLELLQKHLPAGYETLSTDEQKIARKEAGSKLHPMTISDNEKAWSIVHKHNGVALVQLVLNGTLRVICNAEKGFDWQPKVIADKFVGLFGERQTREEKRMEVRARLEGKRVTDLGAYHIRKDALHEANVDEMVAIDGGVHIFMDNTLKIVNPVDLVGSRVRYFHGDVDTRRLVFLGNLEAVKGAIAFVKLQGFAMHIERAGSGLK